MNWGSNWDDKKQETTGKAIAKRQAEAGAIEWPTNTSNYIGIDLEIKDIVEAYCEVRTRTNKTPTHDPYTNPNAHIYYSCKCGQILDPGTKSFSQLNNAASEAGWKIRMGWQQYDAYCVECGKEVK